MDNGDKNRSSGQEEEPDRGKTGLGNGDHGRWLITGIGVQLWVLPDHDDQDESWLIIGPYNNDNNDQKNMALPKQWVCYKCDCGHGQIMSKMASVWSELQFGHVMTDDDCGQQLSGIPGQHL